MSSAIYRASLAVLLLLSATIALLAACAPRQSLAGSTGGAATAPASVNATASATTSRSATATRAPSPTSTARATGGGAPTATAGTAAFAPYSFPLLPPGSALPDEAFCAAHVQRSAWEPRPENAAANARVPTGAQIAALSPWDQRIGVDPQADALRKQITGNFTGATDEILQWVACKWGVPVDIVRAQAVVESYWRQDQRGDQTTNQSDCPPGTWNGSSCYQSYGILQIKYLYFASAWPMSRDDTAFSAEYMYGVMRVCYEGWTTYLNERAPQPGYPAYHAGDLWGCLGRWYSGGWYDQGAINYIAQVKAAYDNQTWRSAGF